MYEDGRYHHSYGTQRICHDVQEDTMHVFIPVGMSVVVAMTVSVGMSMIKCHDTDKVDKKP